MQRVSCVLELNIYLVVVVVVVVFGLAVFKKPKTVVSNGIGMKFRVTVLQVNMH